jgi:Putative transposase
VERIFAEEIARATKRLAGVAGAETGSVAVEQRFGSSLNLHTHIHTLAVDGVFEKTGDGTVRVYEAPPTTNAGVVEVAERVRDRTLRWLRKHGYLDERAAEDRSNAPPEPSALEGCAQLALAGGAFLAKPFEPRQAADADLERRERRFSATCDGFDVHCAVRIAAGDAVGRERLVRYCARPPFALDRISVLRDGRIAYLLKVPRRGRTHRVMTPMEFMARLCVLIPPPRIPAIRYHGVFASRSSWRPLVTPKPPVHAAKPKHGDAATPPAPAPSAPPAPPAAAPSSVDAPASPSPASPLPAPASLVAATQQPAAPPPATLALPVAPLPDGVVSHAYVDPVVCVGPTTISVEHWGRLLDGELLASSRHIDWAVLMKRTFGFDVLTCPRCSRRMRLMATIMDPATIRKILDHLRVRADPLPRAPARDPTWEQTDLGFEAA